MHLLYPVLMVAMTYRTFWVRVRPDALIMFKPNADDDNANDGNDGKHISDAEINDHDTGGSRIPPLLPPTPPPSFLSKVKTGLIEDHSLFAWADKGAWETVDALDEQTRREGDWFRVGFEPLFVDFTQKGSWFMVYTLLEVGSFFVDSLKRLLENGRVPNEAAPLRNVCWCHQASVLKRLCT